MPLQVPSDRFEAEPGMLFSEITYLPRPKWDANEDLRCLEDTN